MQMECRTLQRAFQVHPAHQQSQDQQELPLVVSVLHKPADDTTLHRVALSTTRLDATTIDQAVLGQ